MHLRPRRTAAAVTASVALVLLASCSSSGNSAEPSSSPSAPGAASASSTASLAPRVMGTIATDLDAPWGLAFLPDGYAPDGVALVSERDSGDVVLVATDGTTTGVGRVPGVVHDGEGGLLGIAVAKDFATTHLVYAYLTTATDNRIVRMTFENEHFGTPQVVLSGLRKGPIHDGGRIAFGPDGYLYAGVGDTGDGELAQDLSSDNGKILRMTPTGKPAPGNPFKGSLVWSYGHRNVQGLAWDSKGRMWASEFGQNRWDELNQIKPGSNYGWPVVEGGAKDKRFTDPVAQWTTAEASPSGIAVVDDHVLMAGLRGQRLWVVPLDGPDKYRSTDALVGSQGRLRTVAQAPDGSVWVMTSNTDGRGDAKRGDDRILRISY